MQLLLSRVVRFYELTRCLRSYRVTIEDKRVLFGKYVEEWFGNVPSGVTVEVTISSDGQASGMSIILTLEQMLEIPLDINSASESVLTTDLAVQKLSRMVSDVEPTLIMRQENARPSLVSTLLEKVGISFVRWTRMPREYLSSLVADGRLGHHSPEVIVRLVQPVWGEYDGPILLVKNYRPENRYFVRSLETWIYQAQVMNKCELITNPVLTIRKWNVTD